MLPYPRMSCGRPRALPVSLALLLAAVATGLGALPAAATATPAPLLSASASPSASPSPSPVRATPTATPTPTAARATPSPTSPTLARPAATASGAASVLRPVTPARVLDTRVPVDHPLGAGATDTVYLAPPAGAVAVALNVAVTNVTAMTYVEVWPALTTQPLSSNVNAIPGTSAANLAVVQLGAGNGVSYFNSAGTVDIVLDVVGWYVAPGAGAAGAGLFRPLAPARVLDTRTALGGHPGPLGAGGRYSLTVGGAGNVPAAGVAAVLLNVTAADATDWSYLRLTPAGAGGTTSSLNFGPGAPTCNRVLVAVAGGAIDIYNSAGGVDVIVDVVGWFTDGSDPAASGGATVVQPPRRVYDSRGGAGPLGGEHVLSLPLAAQLPAEAAGALLNLTAADATRPTFFATYPGGMTLPLASDLNPQPGRQSANLQVTRLGPAGDVQVFSSEGATNVVADLLGYFTASGPPSSPPGAPAITAVSSPAASTLAVSWNAPGSTGGSAITSYTVTTNDGRMYAAPGTATSAAIPSSCAGSVSVTLTAINAAASGPASAASAAIPIQCPTSNTITDVPYYRQVYALSCEAAALQMVLAHENINVDQTRELQDMGIDFRGAYYDASGLRWGDAYTNFVGDPNGSEIYLTGYGTYSSDVARVARLYGGQVLREGEGTSPADLYRAIVLGHPVVAWVAFDWRYHAPGSYLAFDGRRIPYAGPIEHAVALAGVTADQVLVLNPWDGPTWMPKSTFEAAFATYNDMAVVVG